MASPVVSTGIHPKLTPTMTLILPGLEALLELAKAVVVKGRLIPLTFSQFVLFNSNGVKNWLY
jgi:hypothetical protein